MLDGETILSNHLSGGGGQSEGAQSCGNDEPVADDSDIIVVQSGHHNVPSASPTLPRQQLPVQFGQAVAAQPQTLLPVEPFHDYVAGPLYPQLTPSSEQEDHLNILTSDGQPSYYGPTSQRYVKYQGPEVVEPNSSKDSDSITELRLDGAPSRNFLLQIFFRVQQLSTPVVDETLFGAGRVRGIRVQWYSSFLENAILACASRMSTSPNLRQLGAQYANRAKQALLEEISAPNIATLQGLLLLSDFEATRGLNRLGYMFCGMACRLVFDLGLTASCTMLVARGKISQADAFERHRLLLAVHVFDKLWSVYMGRPSALQTKMVAIAHQRLKSEGWKGTAAAEAWVGLCTDISDATELLLTSPEPGQATVERLKELNDRLAERFNSLPSELVTTLDQPCELQPCAFALRIQFHGAQIVSRGLLNKVIRTVNGDKLPPRPIDSQQDPQTVDVPCSEMLSNAIAISRLVSTYHDIYGVENIVTVMLDNMYVASAVLVSYILHGHQEPGHAATPRTWLQTLRDIFVGARNHYPVATRMYLTLSKLTQGTILEGMYQCAGSGSRDHEHDRGMSTGPNRLTPVSEAQSFGFSDKAFPGPTYRFDEDPLLGDNFAELVSGGPAGNLMDWLSLGLDSSVDRDMIPRS